VRSIRQRLSDRRHMAISGDRDEVSCGASPCRLADIGDGRQTAQVRIWFSIRAQEFLVTQNILDARFTSSRKPL